MFDGSLGLRGGAGSGRVDAGALGGGVDRTRDAAAAAAAAAAATSAASANLGFSSANTAAAVAAKESVDIRHILSNPLPPPPSDVEFVRSQTSVSVIGGGPLPARASQKSARKEKGGGTKSQASAKSVIGNSFR